MPDYKPNQIVRVFAVLALIAALFLVVVVIATTHGGSSSTSTTAHKSTVTKEGRRALHRGVWIVHAGDTLGAIALKTGVDVDTLTRLNPKIDPQTLLQGERIALR
jgi:LysM repeat protein